MDPETRRRRREEALIGGDVLVHDEDGAGEEDGSGRMIPRPWKGAERRRGGTASGFSRSWRKKGPALRATPEKSSGSYQPWRGGDVGCEDDGSIAGAEQGDGDSWWCLVSRVGGGWSCIRR